MRYPEQLQFRAAPGSASIVQRVADAEGKSAGAVLREALEMRLAAASAAGEHTEARAA